MVLLLLAGPAVRAETPTSMPSSSPLPTAVPTTSTTPTTAPTTEPTPVPLPVNVSTFAALSYAIESRAQIDVVNDITFTAAITISSMTNVKISSSIGAVLKSDRSFGGMFYISSASDVTFTGLQFASGSGSTGTGCMDVTGSTIELKDVEFNSCSTSWGGSPALRMSSSTATISGSKFAHNSAIAGSNANYARGAAMYMASSTATISDTTFTSNLADNNRNYYALGGALFLTSSTATIFGSTFASNTAKYNLPVSSYGKRGVGGALYMKESIVTISGTTFTSNNANAGNDIYIYSSTLNCTAGCNDGGMYMPNGSCTSSSFANMYGGSVPDGDKFADNTYGGSCTSYCSSASSDCAVCPANTYYEGYSTNSACDACTSGKYITDEGSNASAHDEADDCAAGVGYPTPVPSLSPTPLPSYTCDESENKYLYKLVMTDTGGDGWGDVTYTITTNGTARFTGTLADGYRGVHYFCIEDNVHTIVLNGSKTEHSDICFEFDDTLGDAFFGCAPNLDFFHTVGGEVFGAPSAAPTTSSWPTTAPSGTPSQLPSPLPTLVPSYAPSALPSVSPLPSATPSAPPSTFPSPVPTSARPTPMPTSQPSISPTSYDYVTVTGEFTIQGGLNVSRVEEDDLKALAEGIASIDDYIVVDDIDNVAIEQSSGGRRLRGERRRLLDDDVTVTFDVSVSIEDSVWEHRDSFITAVKNGLKAAVSDGSLMGAIESASSDDSPFAGGLAVCCASYTAVIRPTGSPTPQPTKYEESDAYKEEQLDWYAPPTLATPRHPTPPHATPRHPTPPHACCLHYALILHHTHR